MLLASDEPSIAGSVIIWGIIIVVLLYGFTYIITGINHLVNRNDSDYKKSHKVSGKKQCSICGGSDFTKNFFSRQCQRCATEFNIIDYLKLQDYERYDGNFPNEIINKYKSKVSDDVVKQLKSDYGLTLDEYFDFINGKLKTICYEDFDNKGLVYSDCNRNIMVKIFESFFYIEPVVRFYSSKEEKEKELSGEKFNMMMNNPIEFMQTYCYNNKNIKNIKQEDDSHFYFYFGNNKYLTWGRFYANINDIKTITKMYKMTIKKLNDSASAKAFEEIYGISWSDFRNEKFLFRGYAWEISNDKISKHIYHLNNQYFALMTDEELKTILKKTEPDLNEIKQYFYTDFDVTNVICRDASYSIGGEKNIIDAAIADAAFGDAGVFAYCASDTGIRIYREEMIIYIRNCSFRGVRLSIEKLDSLKTNYEAYSYFKNLK